MEMKPKQAVFIVLHMVYLQMKPNVKKKKNAKPLFSHVISFVLWEKLEYNYKMYFHEILRHKHEN